LPAGPRVDWRERIKGLRDIWAMMLLFCCVIGGLYGACLLLPKQAGWEPPAPF